MRKLKKIAFLALVITPGHLFSDMDQDISTKHWPMFGHDIVNTANNVGQSKINSKNVSQLVPLWSVQDSSVIAQPIISADNIVYYTDFTGNLYARNGNDGNLIWSYQLNFPGTQGISAPHLDGEVLYIGGKDAYAFNRHTGTLIWSAVLDPHPTSFVSSSPNSAEGLVFFGTDSNEQSNPTPYTFRGAVYALDAQTGNLKWKFVPSKNAGPGVAIHWSSPALDTENGLLYIGTGTAEDFPAGDLSDALIALNYRTQNPEGELKWSYQFTANDVFSAAHPEGRNQDVLASPHVFNVGHKKLVGVSGKGGHFAAFNRLTGALEWKVDLIPQNFLNSIVNNASGTTAFIKEHHDEVQTKTIVTLSSYDPNNALPLSTFLASTQGDFPAIQQTVRALTQQLVFRVTALKASDGSVIWTRDYPGTGSQALTATEDVVFVFGYNGILAALDAKNGNSLWELYNPFVDIFGVTARIPFGSGATINKGKIYFGAGLQPIPGGIFCYTLPTED
jgi:polyvinyl alcohol dehydrogenase (cytochrome)